MYIDILGLTDSWEDHEQKQYVFVHFSIMIKWDQILYIILAILRICITEEGIQLHKKYL
jgi:hypothetical protein